MAVVGPSGCGKTTLLKAIAGMIAETDGRFFWNGHDLAEEDFEPSEIGLVPQFSIAYDQLSVDENVESAARLRCRFDSVDDLDDSIDNALEVTGMEGIADRDVKILSGGQKRRVAIAGVIAMEPKVLVLDEPTAGLDPQGRDAILAQIQTYHRAKGAAVVLVSHSMEEIARNVERIAVLSDGRVLMQGTPEQVFARAHELEQVGLDVPQVTKVAAALRARGLDIDPAVYTVEALEQRLLALRGGAGAC